MQHLSAQCSTLFDKLHPQRSTNMQHNLYANYSSPGICASTPLSEACALYRKSTLARPAEDATIHVTGKSNLPLLQPTKAHSTDKTTDIIQLQYALNSVTGSAGVRLGEPHAALVIYMPCTWT